MKIHLYSAVALAVGTGTVHAQDDAATPVVTISGRQAAQTFDAVADGASRLGLTVREAPASVEVLTQEAMQQRGDRTLTEALRGAAGLSGGNPPSAPVSVTTRGFNSILFLYDGMRSSGAGTTNRVEDTWNYERIEILKGPASVLNGDSAIGGIVNLVTKKPDRARPGAEGFVSYGSYGSVRAGVGVGGAVGETGAYRLDYSHNDSKVGTIARAGEKVDHLTGGLAFDLAGDVKLALSFDYLKDDNQGYFGTPLVPAAFATQPTSAVSTPDGRVIDRRIAANNYNVLDDDNSSETYWLRAKLSGVLAGGWSWRNELAVNQAKRMFMNSESAVFAAPGDIVRDQTLITHDQHYAANRFDISHAGAFGGLRNRFVAGAEIARTDFDSQRRFSDSSAATRAALLVPALQPSVGYFDHSAALSTGGGNRVDNTTDVRSAAVFAEDALKLADGVTVVGGLRHDRIDVDRTSRDLNTGTYAAFGTRYSTNSARLGIVADVARDATVYAQFTTASIPVNTLFLYSAANTAFPLSEGKQAEVGFKQSIGGIDWTAAAYRIELSDVLSRDAVDPALTVNNGRQSSNGVELTAAWNATRQWTLSGNAAALRAKYDTLVEAGGVSRVGNVPTNVPQRVYNVFSNYRFDGLPLDLFIGANRTGAMYTDTANQIRIAGHTTADAALTYRFAPATVTFRVRNLTDKLYATYGGRAASQVLLAPQRTFELSARFSL